MENKPRSHDPYNVVARLLKTALDTHGQREKMYGGDTSQNVFESTANISNIILRKNLNAFDVAIIFTAMKLARYSNILELIDHFKDNENMLDKLTLTAWDSVLDAMVYMSLSERERGKLEGQPDYPEPEEPDEE